MSEEVYYLSSLESERLAPVRECKVLFRTQFTSGKECLVVKVQPEIVAQEFGTPVLDTLVLVSRHEGEGLSPIGRFPCFVFVCRNLRSGHYIQTEPLERSDLEIIGWGELYRTSLDAEEHRFDAIDQV